MSDSQLPLGEDKKRCRDCGEVKSLTEFPRNRNAKDGRHTYCKPCHNARGRESRERLYGGNRHYHLKRRYGIGADEFDRLVELQGGVCPICGRENPEHVDHDHESGRVRGLLCMRCNNALGLLREDADVLGNAIGYVYRQDPDGLGALANERAKGLVGTGGG